ncbi:alanine racemase [Paenarthrobacter sp. FR1]|uniref:alanine racemase n=1 Tax=Paenarthrobacter sp. FR1 TaxID=3439548 RepID=UPI003DA4E875
MATETLPASAERTIPTNPVDYHFKAFPAGISGMSLAEIPERQWNALNGDFSLPVMVLKEKELAHNIERMAGWCKKRGVFLAPHAKTTMSPQLVHRQLEAGAWAVTVATVSQARVLAEFGVERMIIANQVLARSDLEWICAFRREDEAREVYVLVDSHAGVQLMDAELKIVGDVERPLPVLLELGYHQGRAGCRTTEEALAVAHAIDGSSHLDLVGVEGFEGLVPGETALHRLIAARTFLAHLAATVRDLHSAALLPTNAIVTCGGSSYFDEVVRVFIGDWEGPSIRVVLRSGCYITHDHGLYQLTSPFRDEAEPFIPALEVWATVLSVPSPGLAIVGCGRRDVPYDAGMPIPLLVRSGGVDRPPINAQVTSLNDQHLFLSFSAQDRIGVGDLVCLGISHPCSAFDRWTLIPLVDDSYRVMNAIRTYF